MTAEIIHFPKPMSDYEKRVSKLPGILKPYAPADGDIFCSAPGPCPCAPVCRRDLALDLMGL